MHSGTDYRLVARRPLDFDETKPQAFAWHGRILRREEPKELMPSNKSFYLIVPKEWTKHIAVSLVPMLIELDSGERAVAYLEDGRGGGDKNEQ